MVSDLAIVTVICKRRRGYWIFWRLLQHCGGIRVIVLLRCINMVYYINGFLIVYQPWIPGINLTWLWFIISWYCIYLLMFYWGFFAFLCIYDVALICMCAVRVCVCVHYHPQLRYQSYTSFKTWKLSFIFSTLEQFMNHWGCLVCEIW